MKKKLILSSILTPIIPAAALVSCGSGAIVLDYFYQGFFAAYSNTYRIDEGFFHSHFDLNLFFNFKICGDFIHSIDPNKISLGIVAFEDGLPFNKKNIDVNPETSVINKIAYNGKTLERGSADSDEDCWYLVKDYSWTYLYVNITSGINLQSTLSFSLSIEDFRPDPDPDAKCTFTPAILFLTI